MLMILSPGSFPSGAREHALMRSISSRLEKGFTT
jgi:hypothetical protein